MTEKKDKTVATKTTSEKSIKKKPKVSVILSVYNMENYLHECLDSLVGQTLKDIEIICVDDSSTDSSYSILEEYAKKDKRFRIEQQPHAGAGAARNKGMALASGEYLSILDSDDFYEPDMLESAYNDAVSTEADIVVFRCDFFDQKRNTFGDNNWSIIPERLPGKLFKADDIPEKIFNIGAGWAWDKLYKKALVDSAKVCFQDLRTTNDMFFVLYLYTKAETISFLDKVLAHRRINNKDSLSSTREESWDNVFFALKELKERLKEDKTYEKYRQSFVNWALNLLLWHIKTLDKKASDKLKEKCREEFFYELDITGNDIDYYYDESERVAMETIMEGPVKVSVIVPVYNSSAYLNQCLDSICGQTLKNIEIICVDDGSTDNSLEILKSYAERDTRVFVVEKEHTNAGDARNEGMAHATGEYLSFLDSDDFFEPHMLEVIYNRANEEDSDICLFRSNQFDHNSGRFHDTPWTLRDWEMPAHRPFSAKEAKDKIFNMSGATAWDKLFKSEFIFENCLLFQSNYTSNDMLFTFTAMALSERISTVDDVLAHQRTGHAKTLAKDVEYCTSCFAKALLALKESLEEREIYDIFRKSYLNWAVDFSLFNIHAYKGMFSDLIRQQLKLRFFEDMDIYGTPEEDFYNREQYEEMTEIMSERTEHNPEDPPKVSVIIPIYNVAHYLPLALDSAIYQTLEDIEIICVNDGSTDNSLEIINEYAKRDPRIIVITGKNKGYGHAMNQGLDAARGEYIGIIEPDDFVDVNMYEQLYDNAKAHELDLVKSDFYRFTHDDLGYLVLNRNAASKIDDDYDIDLTPLYDTRIFNYVMNTWSGIYKKKLIDDNNIRHNETPGASFQDNGFWFQTMSSASKIRFLKQPYYYNRRDNPDSSVADTEKVYAMNNEYGYIYSLLEKDREKYNLLIGTYHLKRFHNYLFTYDRIDESFRHDYIKKISEDFRKSFEAGEIDELLFSETEFKNLKWIMEDPDDYYDKHNDSNPVKVSVIVPVYNTASYLPEALNSILNQTLEDIEIICVDDSSDDDSWDILNDYAKRDDRIKIIRQEHLGAGAARNIALEIAKGEFLSFLDSDDFFAPTLLEKAFNVCRRTGADICVYKVRRFDMNTGKYTSDRGSFVENNIPKTEVFNADDMQNRIFNTFQTWTWNKLFRTSFIREYGISFQETLRTNDMYFVNTALLKAKRISVLREELVNYREGGDNNSQATNNVAPTDFFKALCKLREEVLEKKQRSVMKSFNNLFVRSCNYNLSSLLKTDANAYMYLYTYLHDEGFRNINPREIDKSTISKDNINAYNECIKVSKCTFAEYMVDKLIYNRKKVEELLNQLKLIRNK